MKWKEAIVIGCGDDMNVVCANNKSVSVWEFGGGIKSPHARIFLTHSQTSRRTSRKPPIPHASRCANHTHGSQHGCKENVKSALQRLQSISNGVTLGVEKKKGVSIMIIGTLKSSPGKAYLTFNDAKRQIRALAKKGKFKPAGTFRPRRLNRGELSLPIEGGHVVASRQPGAEVRVLATTVTSAPNLDADTLAAITAQG